MKLPFLFSSARGRHLSHASLPAYSGRLHPQNLEFHAGTKQTVAQIALSRRGSSHTLERSFPNYRTLARH
nr:MAG TPA: hypothetical protein [Caudoviricetes sp.]